MDNGDDSDEEFVDGNLATLNSFVAIEFQGQEYRTSVRPGNFPQWNQPLDLNFIPQGRDGRAYTTRNLASIGDPIKISLFDERIIHNETERQYRAGVSYRRERRFLGGISIPFSTIYMNQTVHGALPLKKPVLTLGYRGRGQIVEGELINPLSERSRCDTLLHCTVSIEPPLPRGDMDGQLKVLKAPGEARSPRPAAPSFDGPPPRRQ